MNRLLTQCTVPACLAMLLLSTGCQYQWINDTPGMSPVDEPPPSETSTGFEPEISRAELIIDEDNRAAYFAVDVVSEWELDSIYLIMDDGSEEPDYFVAEVDELEQMSLCDWIANTSGSSGGALGVPGVDLGGLGVTSCTAACEEACSCIQSCDEFPADLGIVGNATALCTASCSLGDGLIAEDEFVETYMDSFACTQKPSCATPQFIGLTWETNYPSLSNDAQIAMKPVTKPTDPITNRPTESGEVAVGREEGCFPLRSRP